MREMMVVEFGERPADLLGRALGVAVSVRTTRTSDRLGVVVAHLETDVRLLLEDGTFRDVRFTDARVIPLDEVDEAWLTKVVRFLDGAAVGGSIR